MQAVERRPHRNALRREHLLTQRTVRLSARGLERVNGRILELLELLADEPGEEGDSFYTVTLHLAPNGVRGDSSGE